MFVEDEVGRVGGAEHPLAAQAVGESGLPSGRSYATSASCASAPRWLRVHATGTRSPLRGKGREVPSPTGLDVPRMKGGYFVGAT